MKTLKNAVKLSSQVTIYVPSTFDVDKKIDSEKYVDMALTLLSSKFNGATSSKALGAWLSQSGKLVKEEVTTVFSYANQVDLENSIDEIYDFCLKMKIELKQEVIGLEVNGSFYLI